MTIRTILGDIDNFDGSAYLHEHLILYSPLIAALYPHIHLHDVETAVREVDGCRAAGVSLMVDAMPAASGSRDVVRLADVARRAAVHIVVATGLHHDRYYGSAHWTNRVGTDRLASLFVADLLDGVDEFDYTGPVVRRTAHRAGVVKVSTSGEVPDARDRRNLAAVAAASVATGAPVLTHCEDGRGALAQVDALVAAGVPAGAIILSHVDKTHDLVYLRDLAQTGAILELDQALREHDLGAASVTVRAIADLVAAGHVEQIVVGTDGARRALWRSLGGAPGLAWLAERLPAELIAAGVPQMDVERIMQRNAVRVLTWRPAA